MRRLLLPKRPSYKPFWLWGGIGVLIVGIALFFYQRQSLAPQDVPIIKAQKWPVKVRVDVTKISKDPLVYQNIRNDKTKEQRGVLLPPCEDYKEIAAPVSQTPPKITSISDLLENAGKLPETLLSKKLKKFSLVCGAFRSLSEAEKFWKHMQNALSPFLQPLKPMTQVVDRGNGQPKVYRLYINGVLDKKIYHRVLQYLKKYKIPLVMYGGF